MMAGVLRAIEVLQQFVVVAKKDYRHEPNFSIGPKTILVLGPHFDLAQYFC